MAKIHLFKTLRYHVKSPLMNLRREPPVHRIKFLLWLVERSRALRCRRLVAARKNSARLSAAAGASYASTCRHSCESDRLFRCFV